MGRSYYECPSRTRAKGFIDGLNYMGDESIRVTGALRAKDGAVVLELEDDDESRTEKFRHKPGRGFRKISVDRLCK